MLLWTKPCTFLNCLAFCKIHFHFTIRAADVLILRPGVKCYNKTADCSPSSDFTGLYKSPKWRDGLHYWRKGQVNFDAALTDFNSRQFKTWMKKMAAQVNFCLFRNVFSVWLAIWCLKIGTNVFIKVVLTYFLPLFRIHSSRPALLAFLGICLIKFGRIDYPF